MADLLSLSASLRERGPPDEEAVPLVGHTGAFYSGDQREKLENYFCTNILTGNHSFMTRKAIQNNLQTLSRTTGLSRDQIRMWLRNRKKRGGYKGKTVHDALQIRGLEWAYTTHSKYPSARFKRRLAGVLGLLFDFFFSFTFMFLFYFFFHLIFCFLFFSSRLFSFVVFAQNEN